MAKRKKYSCSHCIHSGQLTLSDVACCNCCEDGEFFDRAPEFEEDEEDDN